MLIKRRRTWELPETATTPEGIYRQRRQFMQYAGAGSLLLFSGGVLAGCGEAAPPAGAAAGESSSAINDPSAGLYPVPRNEAFQVARAITDENLATTYNNFYEFGSSKTICPRHRAEAAALTVAIGGAVEKPQEIAIDDLLARVPLRSVYRLRCVEACRWSCPVGFQLSHSKLAQPLSSAR